MRPLITVRDIEALLAGGKPPPPDAILTPAARDAWLRRASEAPARPGADSPGPGAAEPAVPDFEFHWKPGAGPKTPEETEAFFRSPQIEMLKRRVCDIGRRIWERDYVDGNGGNISIRVGDNLVLCTPTLISKGFMTPSDLCLTDLEGRQLCGSRKRTSEMLTHLGIMRRQPLAKACIHAHPPHATAFAVAGVKPPPCLIPEAEVFLGDIGYAPYETPGSPQIADSVGEVGRDHQCVIMENHGIIVWGKDVEDAYWKMENVDAYCKTIWVATQLAGGRLHRIETSAVRELIALRKKLGMPDTRDQWKECELCDSGDFRPGVVCPGPAAGGPAEAPPDPEVEQAVARLTEEILRRLDGRGA